MPNNKLKLITTRIAKQVSGYTMLMYDMQFSAMVFGLAAKLDNCVPNLKMENQPSTEIRLQQLLEMDSILRAGAAIAQIDPDNRNENETIKSALFEAGIITYGRCFNSGLRTRLSPDIFTGKLSANKNLHASIIKVRDKHIAHAELKMENSIVGCQLVEDLNYGKRPNLIMATLRMRRHFPNSKKLEELEKHCDSIVKKVIYPMIIDKSKALREELLKMTPEQIATFEDFNDHSSRLSELL